MDFGIFQHISPLVKDGPSRRSSRNGLTWCRWLNTWASTPFGWANPISDPIALC